MKPLDPRLLRYACAARGVLGIGGALGFVRTIAIVAWCWCLAQLITVFALPVIAEVTGGLSGQVSDHAAHQTAVPTLLAGAIAALLVRSCASWGMDVVAARGAVQVKAQLRSSALDALDARSPEHRGGRSDAELTTVLGRGLDALDGYFSGYLPQLILTVVATPIVVVAVFLADVTSAVVVILVFPAIPLFMILIGLATQTVQDRQWAQLQRLSASFHDTVSGLATLRIFRREAGQSARIRHEAEEYRSRTMRVLRVTFLSGFVLDLAGTFSIALVAVTVGTRLVAGDFSLALGLFVLLLLPEAFVPIRQVGAAFHSSTEGLAASAEVFDIIEDDAAPLGALRGGPRGALPDASTPGRASSDAASGASAPEVALECDAATFTRGGRTVVGPVSFTAVRGEVVALAGPSGAGKSTIVSAALGFLEPATGHVRRFGAVSWAGQRPGLLQGSVGANVSIGETEPDLVGVTEALRDAALDDIEPERMLGATGSGLSGGQAQRVALARALYRARRHDVPLLLLDEPTSALDADTEQRVCQMLRAEAQAGRAVLVVSHRPAVLAAADRVVRVASAERKAAV